MSSRDVRPQYKSPDLDGGEERGGVFGVSCGDTAPPFEMQEGVFDQMPQLVKVFVIRSLHGSVFARRNDRRHALLSCLLDDRVTVVAFVCQQIIGLHARDQAVSLRTIRCGTLCNNDSERHTMRIHGQMYLGVEPPLVRLMSWFPPLAPAACG